MASYKAPLDDMRFILHEVLNVSDHLSKLDAYDADMVGADTVNAFLNEGAKISEDVLMPLNLSGDREGCHYDGATGDVKTPKGFKEAYDMFVAGGWPGLSSDPAYGGMGMPHVLDTAIKEMFCSSNMSFAMYPGLSHGAYNALHKYGSDELKDTYLPKMTTGEWSGTMCLTESNCGTDLGLMKTKATKQEDGSYKITGEKIFISAGEQDLTDNILHLVLAKIDDPDTPDGIKGVSLFLVPKFKPTDKNEPGERNTVKCGGIEEKMGIHANSTCVMQFDGAEGHIIGEPNKGMKAMFVMMNEARLGVAMQGLGLTEVSYQNALEYAKERIQGKSLSGRKEPNSTDKADPIIVHPGVRQELLTMKSISEAERMMSYWAGMLLDLSEKGDDKATRKQAEDILSLLTPILKAHFSDNAVNTTSMGMQVFGGHGFIEEYGMAQFMRDARITRTYEGTNGVQAMDLIGRKVFHPTANVLPAYLKELEKDLKSAKNVGGLGNMVADLKEAQSKLKWTTRKLKYKAFFAGRKNKGVAAEGIAAAAMYYQDMMSLVVMSHMHLKMATVAQERLDAGVDNKAFYETKIKTAEFYFQKVLPEIYALDKKIGNGPKTLMDMASENFVHDQTTIAEENTPRAPAKSVWSKCQFWKK